MKLNFEKYRDVHFWSYRPALVDGKWIMEQNLSGVIPQRTCNQWKSWYSLDVLGLSLKLL